MKVKARAPWQSILLVMILRCITPSPKPLLPFGNRPNARKRLRLVPGPWHRIPLEQQHRHPSHPLAGTAAQLAISCAAMPEAPVHPSAQRK